MTLLAERQAAPAAGVGTRRRWAIVIAVAVLLVAAFEGFWYWRTNLHEFGPGGNEISAQLSPGQTILVDTGLAPHPARVDLRSVHPRITSNSADASVQVLTCVEAPVGAVYPDATTAARCTPVRPGAVTLDYRTEQLVYAITVKRAGTVHIAGAAVRYADGIRTGSEHSGIRVVVQVR